MNATKLLGMYLMVTIGHAVILASRTYVYFIIIKSIGKKVNYNNLLLLTALISTVNVFFIAINIIYPIIYFSNKVSYTLFSLPYLLSNYKVNEYVLALLSFIGFPEIVTILVLAYVLHATTKMRLITTFFVITSVEYVFKAVGLLSQ